MRQLASAAVLLVTLASAAPTAAAQDASYGPVMGRWRGDVCHPNPIGEDPNPPYDLFFAALPACHRLDLALFGWSDVTLGHYGSDRFEWRAQVTGGPHVFDLSFPLPIQVGGSSFTKRINVDERTSTRWTWVFGGDFGGLPFAAVDNQVQIGPVNAEL